MRNRGHQVTMVADCMASARLRKCAISRCSFQRRPTDSSYPLKLPAPADAIREVLLGPEVAALLRRKILDGEFKPGERLREERLAAEFHVSRSPVREAIQLMISEGLAVPTVRRGAYVADFSPDMVLELVEVRAALEGLVARLAARNRSADVLARLHDVMRRGIAGAESGSATEQAALNCEFHELLALGAANRLLQDAVWLLRERADLVFRGTISGRAPENWCEHEMILEAVAERDEEVAERVAIRHVYRAVQAMLHTLENSAKRSGKTERREDSGVHRLRSE